jgi:hypothetical protein
MILGTVSLASFIAAYWNAPPASENEEALKRRFKTVHNSLADLGVDMDNTMMLRLHSQVQIIMSHLTSLFLDADGNERALTPADLKSIVAVATQTRSVVESLLQCRTLRKLESASAPRFGSSPEGLYGMAGIRQWILGGMRAELELEKNSDYAKAKVASRKAEEKRKIKAKEMDEKLKAALQKEDVVKKDLNRLELAASRAVAAEKKARERDLETIRAGIRAELLAARALRQKPVRTQNNADPIWDAKAIALYELFGSYNRVGNLCGSTMQRVRAAVRRAGLEPLTPRKPRCRAEARAIMEAHGCDERTISRALKGVK